MEVIISVLGFILVCGIIYALVKKPKSTTKPKSRPLQPKATPPTQPEQEYRQLNIQVNANGVFTFGSLRGSVEKGWIVNDGAMFPLTIQNTTLEVAQRVRTLLNRLGTFSDFKDNYSELTNLIVSENIIVKEIEDFVIQNRNKFTQELKNILDNSQEFEAMGEMDQENFIEEAKEKAADTIEGDGHLLLTLIEDRPIDLTLDDELVQEYGFDTMSTFLRYHDSGIQKIDRGHYLRASFEKLVSLGLCLQGKYVDLDLVLNKMKLMEMNEIAQPIEKPFTRKKQAIEYLLTLSDIEKRAGKFIAFNELFQVIDLPIKYAHINLEKLSNYWTYYYSYTEALVITFRTSLSACSSIVEYPNAKYFVRACSICTHRESMEETPFTLSNIPQVPRFIGCECAIFPEPEY